MKTTSKLTTSAIIAIAIVMASPLWVSAQPNESGSGNCLDFVYGNDTYVECANTSLLNTANGTIEAWIYVRTYQTSGCCGSVIVNKSITQWRQNKVLKFWIDGRLEMSIYDGSSWHNAQDPNPIATNEWIHVAGIWGSSGVKLYINGILVGSDPYTGAVNSNYTTTTGEWKEQLNNPNSNGFGGQIDEVRIWNYARNQTQIRENMCRKLTGNESGLVGYWRFDEGSGNTAFDSSPNNNNGTLQ